ncbi:hypothetical protein EYF80_064934 [Liparis tanakae]|uniref:Uncharacterized protein n=1 Tax=Liparis tanakae TaxID=230148 RepID=A0A4Z2E826_9TELE|nr:hypothetical protein EYF80_064934 [Liparis tanakae]
MIESSALPTVRTRGVHLSRRRAGDLEAVGVLPAPRGRSARPPPHPSTRVPRHIPGAAATNTNHPINGAAALPRRPVWNWNTSPLRGGGGGMLRSTRRRLTG